MSILLNSAFIFFIGSSAGWVLELFYRRFFSGANPERKWINPGVLIGPCIPLYGSGLCIVYLLSVIEEGVDTGHPVLQKVLFFAICGALMTLIELIAGLMLLRFNNVMLWDYTKRPLNYKGLICPEFSLAWTGICVAYYYILHPYIQNAVAWLEENLALSFFLGMYFGIFVVDLVYSTKLLSKIKSFAIENGIVVRFEGFKNFVITEKSRRMEKLHFLHPLRSELSLAEFLGKYKEKLEALPAAERIKSLRK